MTKYTDEQIDKAGYILFKGEDTMGCLIDYLRSDDFKADAASDFWAEPLDPIEQARRDAREIVAEYWEEKGDTCTAGQVFEGNSDTWVEVRCALTALCQERGLEVPK